MKRNVVRSSPSVTWLFLGVLLWVPLASQAQHTGRANPAGPFPLVSIHAIGSQRYAEADIVSATGLKIGDTVRPEDFKPVADKLAATGAFEEVGYKYAPAGTGITVEFKVSDAPNFLRVGFDNFVWFTDQELTDAVHARVPLFKGEVPADGNMIAEITDALQGLLAERGITGEVRFQLEEEHLGAAIREGTFGVEGVDIRIRNVQFPGAAPDDLPELRASSEGLLKLPYQRSTAASFAKLNLRPIYWRRGYLKVGFGEPATKLVSSDPKEPAIELTIQVTPGLQYRLGAVRWTGNKALPTYDLEKLVSLKVGQSADALALQQNLETVHDTYARRGYLHEHASEVPTFDDSVQVVSYELQVDEGAQYKFASVDITGLDARTHDRVREVWSLREGEPYDPGYIKTFLQNAGTMLPPGAITRVNPDINERDHTVEVNIHFDFQKRIVERPAK